jgi:hypothetical protein
MSQEPLQKKAKTQTAKPVDRATPVIRKPKGTDGEKVSVTRSMTTAMKAAPQWNAASALQAAVTVWNAAADGVESNAKSIADARSKLATLVATQRTNRQGWLTATKQVTGAAAVVCEGSADVVHALGFDVLAHVAPKPQAAPTGLVTLSALAAGEAGVGWQRGTARNGFVVQRAADPTNPATIAAAVPCTKTKYTIEGAPSASIVHFRVAAIDTTSSTGTGPWSDWVSCTVR